MNDVFIIYRLLLRAVKPVGRSRKGNNESNHHQALKCYDTPPSSPNCQIGDLLQVIFHFLYSNNIKWGGAEEWALGCENPAQVHATDCHYFCPFLYSKYDRQVQWVYLRQGG